MSFIYSSTTFSTCTRSCYYFPKMVILVQSNISYNMPYNSSPCRNPSIQLLQNFINNSILDFFIRMNIEVFFFSRISLISSFCEICSVNYIFFINFSYSINPFLLCHIISPYWFLNIFLLLLLCIQCQLYRRYVLWNLFFLLEHVLLD